MRSCREFIALIAEVFSVSFQASMPGKDTSPSPIGKLNRTCLPLGDVGENPGEGERRPRFERSDSKFKLNSRRGEDDRLGMYSFPTLTKSPSPIGTLLASKKAMINLQEQTKADYKLALLSLVSRWCSTSSGSCIAIFLCRGRSLSHMITLWSTECIPFDSVAMGMHAGCPGSWSPVRATLWIFHALLIRKFGLFRDDDGALAFLTSLLNLNSRIGINVMFRIIGPPSHKRLKDRSILIQRPNSSSPNWRHHSWSQGSWRKDWSRHAPQADHFSLSEIYQEGQE